MSHGFFPGIALLLWIPLTWLLYQQLSVQKATLASLAGALMFLPEWAAFDGPLLPPLNKALIPALTCFFMLSMRSGFSVTRTVRSPLVAATVSLCAFAAAGTWMTNTFPIHAGSAWKPVFQPGLTMRDALSMFIEDLAGIFLPFIIGYTAFFRPGHLKVLLAGTALAALIHTPIILLELRLSPVLHLWVYGYSIVSYLEAFRFGGWRPTGFMAHGLQLSVFMAMGLLAAAGLMRARFPVWRFQARTACWVNGVLLISCKSTAAIIYGALMLWPVMFAKPRTLARTTALLAIISCAYPYMRATQTFPTQTLSDLAGRISPERQESLEFRFENEDMLVERMQQNILFGMGGYGRNHIFSAEGKRVSITDGFWIARIGSRGALGLAAPFALLAVPIILAWRRLEQWKDRRMRVMLMTTSVLVVINLIDLLPNSFPSPLLFVYAGALYRFTERKTIRAGQTAMQPGAARSPIRAPPPAVAPQPVTASETFS